MTPEQYEQAGRIFRQACDLEPADRERFLDRACGGDGELRAQVEDLLERDERLQRAPEQGGGEYPPGGGANDGSAGSTDPEDVGPYKILGKLGEGGMGIVYLAEQREPLRRRVALKLVKLGMDTKEVIGRFEAERQALALMDHPNIATVHDAGATADGRPYFVMELFRGTPITEYCDRHKLSIEDRLRLFIQVCEGVGHAHFKGVIHRDLKPSNVLVSRPDEKPVAKIIDFGVAKATNQRLTEKTVYTELGRAVGTPAYMSPEQAKMTTEDVDHRSDIYSLGVLLYELLVGDRPLELDVRSAAFDEIVRRIREEEPPTPSTRWSRWNVERTTDLASCRRSKPTGVAAELRGDLDWIAMKAIEKEPERRYATTAHLAQDIARYVSGEPVLAGPPSAYYRIAKFVRRNRVPVVAAVSVILALFLGFLTTLGFAFQSISRLEEIQRLSDIAWLGEYRRQVDDLWPCTPDRVEAMELWSKEVTELGQRLEPQRSMLKSLRKDGGFKEVPGTYDGRDPELEEELAVRKLQEELLKEVEQRLESGEPQHAGLKEKLAFVKRDIKSLEDGLKERTAWRLAESDPSLQREHDKLVDMVAGLDALTGGNAGDSLLTQIDQRHDFARTVHKRTIEDCQEQWDQAIEAISRPDGPYGGLPIERQLGMVPLGPDPKSRLQEFADTLTGDPPIRDDHDQLVLTDKTGLVFVLLPGGKFQMGAQKVDNNAPNYDSAATEDMGPVREVPVRPFFISKYEMTQGQWQRLTGENPSLYKPESDFAGELGLDHPVEQVSWDACDLWLGRAGLRLPKEKEWEYAARAGTTTVWWTGNDKISLKRAANLGDMDDGHSRHAPVGSFKPNPFGLHDVVGNVYEWCNDRYHPYEMSEVTAEDAVKIWFPSVRLRVNRGAGYNNPSGSGRSAKRTPNTPDTRYVNLGVRPARSLQVTDR